MDISPPPSVLAERARPVGRAALLVALAAALVGAVLAADVMVAGVSLRDAITVSVPDVDFGRYSLLRTLVLAVAAAAGVAGLWLAGDALAYPRGEAREWSAVAADGALAWRIRAAAWGGVALALFCALLLVVAHRTFSRESYEDRSVEWVTTAFLFAATVMYAAAARRYWRSGRGARAYALIAILLAAGCFVTGGEEISWGQRIFGIPETEAFAKNQQGEMNLHNYYTNAFENVYYFGSWLGLVVLPFLMTRFGALRANGILARFAPSLPVVAVGAMMAAYNYDMWPGAVTQLAVFATLAILVLSARRALPEERRLLLAAAAVTAVVQVIFLMHGGVYRRHWEVKEYKEMFLPLGLLITSVEVWHRARQAPGVAPDAPVRAAR